MQTVMKIGVNSSFKSKECAVCKKEAFIAVFEKEGGIFYCIDHYLERSEDANDNKDI